MSYTWDRMIEDRLREITNIADNQFGFRPGTNHCIENAAGEIQREKQKELHMVFV